MDVQKISDRLGADEQRLRRERGALIAELGNEDPRTDELPGVPAEDGDDGSLVVERERDAGLIDEFDTALAEIGVARDRLDAGTYGLCEACGVTIAEERLEVLPATRFCIEHASRRGHGPAHGSSRRS